VGSPYWRVKCKAMIRYQVVREAIDLAPVPALSA
jgi:hypothetical protein